VAHTVRIPFTLRGISGLIAASVTRNADPAAVGYGLLSSSRSVDVAEGFPVCRARITYPADGYAAMFGWTQLVRSSDRGPGGFEMDPIALYADVATPYAWFGLRPELFDAPSRDSRPDMWWEARSFLCFSPDAVMTPRVAAIAGFSWGFTISGGKIAIGSCQPLAASDWDAHLGLLRARYPRWTFSEGFRQA
jgi:hypothetical protein